VGEHGAWMAAEGETRRVPACEVTAVDTTGAGDAFSAALAVALAEGQSLDRAVAFACAAGGFCVQSLGTVPSYATRSQLEDFIAAQALPRAPSPR
jgi:ribokinase